MLVHKAKYLKVEAVRAWWPETVQQVTPLLDQAPVVILWQCPAALAEEVRPWVFRQRSFFTPLIELGRTEEELWQKLEAKSCRYEVRKAQKAECVVSINQETETARLLLNESIRRLGYRSELGEGEWQALLPSHDVFLCRWQGAPVAVHLLMRHPPARARLLLSGTADRGDARFRNIAGPANRLLHWHELLHYKAQGFRVYDFGGCVLDRTSPQFPITPFKLSFGSEVATEPHLYLAKQPALRAVFHAIALAQSGARKIPWPRAWLRAYRTRR
jgi:hypothetical protein